MLAASRHVVTGVDRDGEVVRQAAETYPAASFVDADVLELPFGDESFDAAVCFEVIEHVEDPRRLVAELARVLRPGGLLFISTPNARMERLHARSQGYAENPYHISPLTPRDLRRLLRATGFRVRLYGQARDRGALHVLLQSVDPLGLRLRVPPRRRTPLQAVLQRAARIEPDLEPPYRFARAAAYSAAVTYAEARKR
jgi:SAM-dependent methyltransferase